MEFIKHDETPFYLHTADEEKPSAFRIGEHCYVLAKNKRFLSPVAGEKNKSKKILISPI
ncbi:hypothetical protein [Cronobacter dublinensis]|uniref:hypothetical protein n=1 Tax=Cronobacter dublinensis TaxID=413497 RepID=UPI001F1E30A8|nr:hypothetical protein [Cronobacter dublinensis]